MIFIIIRIFELIISLVLIDYSIDFIGLNLPFWTILILLVHTAFVVSRIKIHFTFMDALQIPLIIFLGLYILGLNPSDWFIEYGNIPLYMGLIGVVIALPRLHASFNFLKKV